MPELVFKGKEFVFNHHLSVPFRPLVAHADKGIGDASLDDNLIIHGDNLHALKALLPMYAGKVDCIFIDPPYNTGNEGWSYNDNVNSPMLREWLNSNPITIEDGLRHDKWAAMMYPRLRLLSELLNEQGSIWITLDDNEVHHARSVLDEIFGADNFVANISWVKRYTRSNNARMFYSLKDSLLVYRKSESLDLLKEPRSASADAGYSNPDDDPRGPWMTASYVNPATRSQRPNLCYPITRPTSGQAVEHPTHAWKYSLEEHQRHVAENLLWWGADGSAQYPRLKLFLSEADKMVPVDVWDYTEVGSSDDGGHQVKRIFGSAVFDNPKPVGLVSKVLSIVDKKDAIVLDSFAGSGTTAHAVLEANKKDGGRRRFVLVEMEDYADTITAERVRRVAQGYSFTGTVRETLLKERITWRRLQNATQLIDRVEALENLSGSSFDRVTRSVTGGEIIVTGEIDVEEQTEGLGGTFTYCTLGDPIDMDSLLTGERLPSFQALASVLFHTATNTPLPAEGADTESLGQPGHGYLGEAAGVHVWLIYQPDLEFLKSSDAALTLAKARTIAEARDGRHVVFAPARFVSQKMLNDADLPVEFAPLPFALYRVERE